MSARRFAVLGVCFGVLLFGVSLANSRHIRIPIPDGLTEELLETGRPADKHLVKRFSQWYHKRGHRGEENCGVQGIAPINPRFKIIGGKRAIPGSWPWMVSIYTTVPTPMHWCGGTLIDEQWVLTAGHCADWLISGFAHYSNYKVRVGKTFLNMPEETEQDMEIEKFITHPFYDIHGLDNDMALIKLKTRIRRSESVMPICLPQPYTRPEKPWTLLTVTGWGAIHTEDTDISPTLQQVAVPIIPRDKCETFPCCQKNLTESMFCAGYEMGGRDACLGDSGSPAQLCDEDGKWHIKGIVSWGGKNRLDCGRAMAPGVYTDVCQFIPWILWELFLNQ